MKPLAIYIHIPFCERRCGYCDFVSCCDVANLDRYLDRLIAEIKAFDFSAYSIKTIYLGGGTPSLLTPAQLQHLFAVLPACDGEISIECNPNSLSRAKFAVYRDLGINRISIGVQSFSDGTLKSLGRIHTVQQAKDAIKLAREYFDNVSIDLIKDIPEHKFVNPPIEILDLIQHISIYSLTRNDQAVLETDEPVKLPREFQHYEISNYARKGYECQHNLIYWTGGEYIGFGAGAHSLLNNQRFSNSSEIMNYRRENIFTRSDELIRQEQIMLGLRLSAGFDENLVKDKTAEVQLLLQNHLIKIVKHRIVATTKGQKILNQLWLRLV